MLRLNILDLPIPVLENITQDFGFPASRNYTPSRLRWSRLFHFFFDPGDEGLFRALASGEFNTSGFQNKDLRRRLKERTSGQISRLFRRLRLHGLIKKVGRTYIYYLTGLGEQVVAIGLKLKQLNIIPALSLAPAR